MSETSPSSAGAFDLSHMVPQGQAQSSDPQTAPQAHPALGAPASSAAISAPLIVDVTEANLQETMALSQTVPIVLVLYSKKSLASKQAVDVLESVARADAGSFQLGKVDVDVSPNVAAAFQVQTVPASFALVAGRPVPLFEGAPTETQVTEVLNELLQVAPQMGVTGRLQVSEADLEKPMPEEHRAARTAEEEGDWDKAVKAWKKVLANNPSDSEAKTALARARFERRYEAETAEAASEDEPVGDLSTSALADSMFAKGDEEGAFNVLLDALTASFDAEEKEKLRQQLVGLFPIATDSAAVKSARTRLATHLMV